MEQQEVVIRAGDCSLTLIPGLGGKIASLRIADRDLLQRPLLPYAARERTMRFDEADASGWDECLPTVAACQVETAAGLAQLPDHGDLWIVPWHLLEATEDSATMRAACFSLPLEVTRSLLLSEKDGGWNLQLLYSVTNLGDSRVPWLWSAHPGFAVEPGDRIVLPGSVTSLRLEWSRGGRLGESGATVSWPTAMLSGGATGDLREVRGPEAGSADKLFAGPFSLEPDARDAWCTLLRPSAGLRLTLRFDAARTPFLGLWLCYGGWPEGRADRQFCVAMEPTTAPFDSLAAADAHIRSQRNLSPGETFSWPLELQIDRLPQTT